MLIAIDLLQETTLILEADNKASGILYRQSNIPGTERESSSRSFSQIKINNSITLEIGPFSKPRRYRLEILSGNIKRSYVRKRLNYNNNGTGIYGGGHITINSGDSTKIDISAGEGVIVDNYTNPGVPEVVRIKWQDMAAVDVEFLLTSFTSYIAIDRGGNVVQFAGAITAENRRDFIVLGILAHTNNVVVETASDFPPPGYDIPHMLVDMGDSIGIINRSGNQFGPNGANLKVNKSAGESFRIGQNWQNSSKVPNITIDAAQSAPTMFFSYRDGKGGWAPPTFSDEVDPGKYDNGSGTLATVAGGQWTIQRLFYEPIGGDIIIAYGQFLYNSAAEAEAAIFGEQFIKNPILNDTALRGFLIVKGNATNLSSSINAKFIAADKFGSGPSVGSSTATTDLQGAYDNSASPEVATDATRGALSIKEGTGTATNDVIEVLNNSNVKKFSVNGNGQITGALLPGATAARPSSPITGQLFFDTTLGIPIWYDGSNWVNASGTTV